MTDRRTSRGGRVREVLVSVAGLTPQIITETIYHLTQERKPPAHIAEIWIVTTALGKVKGRTTSPDE